MLSIAIVLALATFAVLSPRASAAGPAFVQGGDTLVTSGTTASLAFNHANTAGDLIAVYLLWDNVGNVTLSDSRGNTYTAATARTTWGTNWSAQVFYAPNVLGGSNTVTATFGTAIKSFGHRVPARVLRSCRSVPRRRQCIRRRHVRGHEQRRCDDDPGK